jgi:hypothetical protein
LVKFGQGLSYSTFSLACQGGFVSPGVDSITISCNSSITSGPDGDLVLMAFHRPSSDVIGRIGSSHPIPLSSLAGFDRISIGSGDGIVQVNIDLLASKALTLVDNTGANVLYISSSSLQHTQEDKNSRFYGIGHFGDANSSFSPFLTEIKHIMISNLSFSLLDSKYWIKLNKSKLNLNHEIVLLLPESLNLEDHAIARSIVQDLFCSRVSVLEVNNLALGEALVISAELEHLLH